MPNSALPCIVCGATLRNVFPETLEDGSTSGNQPSRGTSFTTSGHYGSTVFDPMSNDVFLEINVCDECMKRCSEEGKIIYGRKHTPRPQTTYTIELWDHTRGDLR